MSNNYLRDKKIDIIRVLTNGTYVIPCAYCEGCGVDPSIDFEEYPELCEPCPVCRGRGINTIPADDDHLFTCRYCGGSGRGNSEDSYSVGSVCLVCHGVGVFCFDGNCDKGEGDAFWGMIDPIIHDVARDRFISGMYADSVEAALKEVNQIVKRLYLDRTDVELDGSALMQAAFSANNPTLPLSDMQTQSDKNIQIGYMQIYSGAMTGIRNPKAHENIIIDKSRAVHFLFLASLLIIKLRERYDI